MNILLIGQCTLHWGRMEYGNIGNYYIIEPFIRELHTAFPEASIKTTFQMSNEFCKRERLEVLPMDYYYGFSENDLDTALIELASAQVYSKTGVLPKITPFIKEVLHSDLVIDFSGDIWGDNANFLGENRFFVGLCKDRVSQLLGKPTVMLAGSPGPFSNQETKEFAKEVYSSFNLVTNREPISTDLLKNDGFNISKTKNVACPAFLFEPAKNIEQLLEKEGFMHNGRAKVGFILCGWNFTEGPFNKENRDDSEFIQFAEAIEYMAEELGVDVYLMSHSNGFPVPPREFKLLHGRDYPIAKQLHTVLLNRGVAKNVYSIDGIYNAWETKSIIGNFDMLVSGRVHGAVAGLSQCVPTVMIDYGHEPKAHKIKGFANVVGVEEYISDPATQGDIICKIKKCWENKSLYKQHLKSNIPRVKEKAKSSFTLLKDLLQII